MSSAATWDARARTLFWGTGPAFVLSNTTPGSTSPRFFAANAAVVVALLAAYFRIESEDRQSRRLPLVRFSVASSFGSLIVLELLSSGPLRPFDDPYRPVLVSATFSLAFGLVLLRSRRSRVTATDGDRRLPRLRSLVPTGLGVLGFTLGAAAVLAPPDPRVQVVSFAVLSIASVPTVCCLVLPRYGIEAGVAPLGYGFVLYFAQVLVVLPLTISFPRVQHLAVTAVLVLLAGAFFASRAGVGVGFRAERQRDSS